MLYLVPSPSNPAPPNPKKSFAEKYTDFIKEPNTPGFFCDFKEPSPKLFSFYAQDSSHGLTSSFSFVIQDILSSNFNPNQDSTSESGFLVPVLVCNFPTIDGCHLSKIVLRDGYLEAILMFLFHLKVLKALFLFSEQRGVKGLILHVDCNYRDWIHAYQDLIVSKDQVMTRQGEQTQIAILIDMQSYDELINLIDTMNAGFRQTLWREQRENLTIRLYLKSYAVLRDLTSTINNQKEEL